jgi:hypothetical protein
MDSRPTLKLVRTNNNGNESQSSMVGGNVNSMAVAHPSLNTKDDGYYRYKARKYHMKIQQKLKKMMFEGQACPAGYEKYLGSFEA